MYTNKEWLYDQFCVQRKQITQIAKETGHGRSTITEWVKKFQLRNLRDPYRAKSWLQQKYCQENQQVERIAAECNVSRSVITSWVVKHNLKRRHWGSYDLDVAYFDEINTQDKAYWLGFIAADGCVINRPAKRLLTITLAKKDESHLVKLSECVGSNKPIHQRKDGAVQLDLCSDHMVRSLIKHGIVERKSKVLKAPRLSEDLVRHWIRGYFDGDGSISRCLDGHTRGQFFGTSDVITFVASNIPANCGCNKVAAGYACGFGGRNVVDKMRFYLYNEANLFLARKRQVFDRK